MSKNSLDKFLALVERSKLINDERLSQTVADWKRQATLAQLDDAQFCADHLVDSALLTRWQCKKLLEGRHRGFFLGRYKLLDHLGSGGMSSVYLAEHVLMQRLVAVKVLPQHRVDDSAYLARFHLEAQAAARLDHRNIVRAYDLDNDGKIHYLVMEYIEGRDLDALVSQDGPLDFHTAAHYIAQAATGLEHAHHMGLVHRDIKPANLLVDLQGTVKILDMGLAKFTGASARPEGPEEHVLGTADYLAPEQAVNSHTVDGRADIYALGCTLYFLLCGHPPFSGTSLQRMTAHQQQTPPSVLLDRPDAPPGLVAICRRMMEKSAANRYQTAAEVHAALADWLASEAALGKTSPSAWAAVAQGAPNHGGKRGPAGSRVDLVSGSASDLHPPAHEPLGIASPLTDTDPNLQRATEKIPAGWPEARDEGPRSHSSQSDVLHRGTFDHPVPPPIVDPPIALPPIAGQPLIVPPIAIEPFATVTAPAPILLTPLASATPDDAPLLEVERSWRTQRATSSGAFGLWAIVLSGMILGALLLALFALAR